MSCNIYRKVKASIKNLELLTKKKQSKKNFYISYQKCLPILFWIFRCWSLSKLNEYFEWPHSVHVVYLCRKFTTSKDNLTYLCPQSVITQYSTKSAANLSFFFRNMKVIAWIFVVFVLVSESLVIWVRFNHLVVWILSFEFSHY